MKQLYIPFLLLLLGWNVALPCSAATTPSLASVLRFATPEKAKELLTTQDRYTDTWSSFDIASRLQRKGATRKDIAELIAYAPSQIRNWTEADTTKMKSIIAQLDSIITANNFHLPLPKEIYLLKTTTKEEGGAGGYTRMKYIVLQDNIVSMKSAELMQVLIHEIFHVLTRNSPEFRKAMYAIIGFKLCPEMPFPSALDNYRISNPDAPFLDSYITLKKEGKPIDCTMIIYSKKEYNGGSFFGYLNIGFVLLRSDEPKQAAIVDDKPVIYAMNEVENFFEQVGRNTNYLIHPEEILANNFIFAVTDTKNLRNQNIVESIRKKLQE